MKENYEAYLRAAKETLDRIDYLIPDDRAKIERGKRHMEYGHALLASDDPRDLRNAASLLMIGAAIIMGTCGASDSTAEYLRRQRCAKGGKAEKQKRKEKREAIEAWQAYARTVERAGAGTTITALAESLLLDRKKPEATPSNLRTLEKFLSKARKERIAGDANPIRLVHSA